MDDDTIGMIDAPELCGHTEDITEYDNRIVDSIEIEPEEERTGFGFRKHFDEVEQQFARYERNFRARRIRELTQSPLGRRLHKRGRRPRVIA